MKCELQQLDAQGAVLACIGEATVRWERKNVVMVGDTMHRYRCERHPIVATSWKRSTPEACESDPNIVL